MKDILNIKNGELAENFEIYSTDGRKILQSKNFKNINILISDGKNLIFFNKYLIDFTIILFNFLNTFI